MACASPWNLYDKNTREFIASVPCGRCVNCLVDARNSIEDLCNEELFQRNYAASYVTLTYDDYHIHWVDDWHGNLKASLRKSDAQNFIKRLRSYLDYKKIDTPLLQRNFRYIYCGEYGEKNRSLPRPHLHFVLFGLDYRLMDSILRKLWNFGQFKLLPVKAGCARYVASYLQKQVKIYPDPKNVFEKHNLQRPFFCHSTRLGWTLFKRQRDFIYNHFDKTGQWCYQSRKGAVRPIPMYIRRRFCLINTAPDTSSQIKVLKTYSKKLFSLKTYNKIKHELALRRYDTLVKKLRSSGEVVHDFRLDTPPDWFVKLYGSSPPREGVSAYRDYVKQLVPYIDNFRDCIQFFEKVAHEAS